MLFSKESILIFVINKITNETKYFPFLSLGFEGKLKIKHLCNSEGAAANIILTCPLITVFLYTASILEQIFVLLEVLQHLVFTSKMNMINTNEEF